MRHLLYVPIIHSAADLGTLGPEIERKSASLYGEERWAKHNETMAGFWATIARYRQSLDAASLRIYQDGLAAGGELGRRIVDEAANRGGVNYQIIRDLLERGAEIRKTEDVPLLMEELKLAQEDAAGKGTNPSLLRFKKARLTDQRDRFVARAIDETLEEGETGVLFMGAYHDVLRHLPRDIVVHQLREQDKVRAYFEALTSRGNAGKLEELGRYLAAPVEAPR